LLAVAVKINPWETIGKKGADENSKSVGLGLILGAGPH
jgi:hypothetical protein